MKCSLLATASLLLCLAGCSTANMTARHRLNWGGTFSLAIMSDKEIAKVDTEQLCGFHGFHVLGTKRIRRELERRDIFTPEEWTIIDKQQIAIGKSKLLLLASWGYPTDTNRTTTAKGVFVQWIYQKPTVNYEAAYVYTRDGIITSMQD